MSLWSSKKSKLPLKPNTQPLEEEEDPSLATAWCSFEVNLKTSRKLTVKAVRRKVVPTFSGIADGGLVYRVAHLEISDI